MINQLLCFWLSEIPIFFHSFPVLPGGFCGHLKNSLPRVHVVWLHPASAEWGRLKPWTLKVFHHDISISPFIAGWWLSHPSEKWWTSSVGMIFPFPTEWKSSNSCSKPPTIHYIPMLGYVLWYFLGYFGLPWWTYHGYPAAAHWKLLELRHVGTQLLVQLSHLGQQLPSQVLLTSASEG